MPVPSLLFEEVLKKYGDKRVQIGRLTGAKVTTMVP